MTDEFAWVIVTDGEAGALVYFAGLGFWSAEHLSAIRFVRKIDAERMLVSLESPSARVEEHGWMAAPEKVIP